MIRYVKRHLSVQVFIITLFIQLLIGVVTYIFVSVVTPKTYLDKIDREIDILMQNAINEFSYLDLQECKQKLLELSTVNNVIIKLTDDAGKEIDYGSDIQFDGDYTAQNRYMKENALKGYTFTPKDENDYYIVYTVGNGERVYLFKDTLKDIIPYLIMFILVISFIVSILCSRYISKPIIKISQTAKSLANLEFGEAQETNRGDEIGLIEESLYELSEHLSQALNELQRANEELKREIENEKQMEKQQLSFFAAVSHELKTPITALKGQLQGMLYNVGGYKDHNKYLNRSLTIVQNMEMLVLQIMSSTQIRSDGFSLQIEKIELRRMILDVINDYEDIAMGKDVFLQAELGQEDIYIEGDISLLRIAVSNILNNAIRYAFPETDVNIHLQKDSQCMIFHVTNQGEQIPETEIENMFLPFTRLEKSRNKATGGSGLGLYLVKMILDMHGIEYSLYNVTTGIQFEILFAISF